MIFHRTVIKKFNSLIARFLAWSTSNFHLVKLARTQIHE